MKVYQCLSILYFQKLIIINLNFLLFPLLCISTQTRLFLFFLAFLSWIWCFIKIWVLYFLNCLFFSQIFWRISVHEILFRHQTSFWRTTPLLSSSSNISVVPKYKNKITSINLSFSFDVHLPVILSSLFKISFLSSD